MADPSPATRRASPPDPPESSTGEWIVAPGKSRLSPAADGKRAWAEYHIDYRE